MKIAGICGYIFSLFCFILFHFVSFLLFLRKLIFGYFKNYGNNPKNIKMFVTLKMKNKNLKTFFNFSNLDKNKCLISIFLFDF